MVFLSFGMSQWLVCNHFCSNHSYKLQGYDFLVYNFTVYKSYLLQVGCGDDFVQFCFLFHFKVAIFSPTQPKDHNTDSLPRFLYKNYLML